jgi:hypothetical protein
MNLLAAPRSYNATGYWADSKGRTGVVALQVNEVGQVLRAAGTSCAPGEGTPAFDAWYRTHSMDAFCGLHLEVEVEPAGYRRAIARLGLGPAYRRA